MIGVPSQIMESLTPDVQPLRRMTSSHWRYGCEKKQDIGNAGGLLSFKLLPLKMNIFDATGDAPLLNWREPRPLLVYLGSLACSTGNVNDSPRKFRVKIRRSES